MTQELTEERIAEGMARVEKVACRPGEGRCYAFPDPVEDARASCTPKGRCKIGWIVSNGGADRLRRHTPETTLSTARGGGAATETPRSKRGQLPRRSELPTGRGKGLTEAGLGGSIANRDVLQTMVVCGARIATAPASV
jgi:hypothetical protein